MMHGTDESDVTSIGPSSSSPTAYYVQSPSHDSHDEIDKYSSNSPLESPSDPRHSMTSSSSTVASRISGNRRRWNKHYCNVVAEEGGGGYDDHRDGAHSLPLRCLFFVLGFGGVCFVIWGASTPYKTQLSIKSLMVENLSFGEGSDHTGVPTKLMTVNCTASLLIYNPATFFGIHVTSHAANLIFSQITVATGQLEKYYQPKRSTRVMWVRLVGQRVPLYGAGTALAASDRAGDGIPFKLEFEIHSRGYLVGKLVRTKHRSHALCSLIINPKRTKQIIFQNNSCKY